MRPLPALGHAGWQMRAHEAVVGRLPAAKRSQLVDIPCINAAAMLSRDKLQSSDLLEKHANSHASGSQLRSAQFLLRLTPGCSYWKD